MNDDDDKKKDFCAHAGDVPPNCAGCDYFPTCESERKVNPAALTREPAQLPVSKIAVDVSKIYTTEEIRSKVDEKPTAVAHSETISKFREAILRHVELNPTKGLDVCTGAVLYLQFMAMPQGVLATHVIQVLADILNAHNELNKAQMVSSTTTPLGMRVS